MLIITKNLNEMEQGKKKTAAKKEKVLAETGDIQSYCKAGASKCKISSFYIPRVCFE